MTRIEGCCPVTRPVAASKLNSTEPCRDVLISAGRTDVEVVYNSGLRGMLDQLPADERFAFQREHLEEVGQLVTDQGLCLEVETLFSSGRKPAA